MNTATICPAILPSRANVGLIDIEMAVVIFDLCFYTHLVISHRFVLVERFEAFLVDCRKVNKDVLGSIICIYQRSVR